MGTENIANQIFQKTVFMVWSSNSRLSLKLQRGLNLKLIGVLNNLIGRQETEIRFENHFEYQERQEASGESIQQTHIVQAPICK